MEQRGTLKNWNDQQGFGFIRPQQGGAEVFAHISALRGERRPVAGDAVLYIVGHDPKGRLRAEHVRLEVVRVEREAKNTVAQVLGDAAVVGHVRELVRFFKTA